MSKSIGEIIEHVPTIDTNYTNQCTDEIFRDNPSCEGIMVVENNVPLALITRINFYQQLGTLYGYNLFMGKSIKLLMNRDILIVDSMTTIVEGSKLAMNRKDDQLYDYVIVTDKNFYKGVVSIRNLLMTFAEVQAEAASYMNPLTGLPGNHLIDKKLKETIKLPTFSVLYIDLDHFKTYNDLYGFSKGDQVIQTTASILNSVINQTQSFLGHIGGDDFVIILNNYDYKGICDQVINRFDNEIKNFYTQEHLNENYIFTENRYGVREKIPLVSISISVVTNRNHSFSRMNDIVYMATKIKKHCKSKSYSCFLVDLEDCCSK